MAVSRRTVARHTSLSRLIIGVTVLASLIAIAPIVAAAFGITGERVAPRTAFASAPSGNYAVVSRTEGQHDIVAVVWAENPAAVTEVARVPHVEGMSATGSVSPDGSKVALVTVDAGTATRQVASLVTVDLVTGELFRVALDIEPNQVPVWAPDGRSIVVTRAVASRSSPGAIQVARVSLEGTEDVLWTADGALGVFPVDFAPSGALIAILIDGRGSTVVRDGAELLHLGSAITRDWELSPDGSQMAYVEANTDSGLRYLARSVRLDGTSNVQTQALAVDVPALGVAWAPQDSAPTFGLEPARESGGVSAQALKADVDGFDIPLDYTSDGSTLAVMRWSGGGFADAGSPQLEIVDGLGRTAIDDYTRFLGWARR